MLVLIFLLGLVLKHETDPYPRGWRVRACVGG
jgi:hypothetical protein